MAMSTNSATEQQLFIGENYFRDLCENIGVALIATDQALRIRTWNHAAARLFGAGAERMFGTDALSILPAERRESAERMLRRAISEGEISELEFQTRDPAGLPREFAASIAPMVSESGRSIGASICIRDITRRIGLQTELLESRKLAALGELAGAIAHHFNNVLGGMVTSLDFAASSSDQPALVKRILAQNSKSLLRAASLVNSLLAFSEQTPVADDLSDLTEVLNLIAHETETSIDDSRIRFRFEIPRLPVVPVPRAHLSTVLRNLIQNALEAMPEGGEITLKAQLDDSRALVSVADTGQGLDEVARARLFEPFWTTKRPIDNAPGTIAGLGLAIARGLTHVMGGQISVRSVVGEGSTFTLSLPVVGRSELHPGSDTLASS